jgi:hypothetical protein
MSVLENLSKDHLKFRFYPDDLPYTLAESILADSLLSDNRVFDQTFLILHPEIFAGGFVPLILDALKQEGFRVHFIEEFFLDLGRAAEIWRYQWNASSVSRMLFFELKGLLAPAAFLGLSRDGGEDLPATLALHLLKGSSRFRERLKPNQFRSLLPFTNRAMTFIHCPDEPADFLRELFILFGTKGARTISARYGAPQTSWDEVQSLLSRFTEQSDFGSFDAQIGDAWPMWLAYLDRIGTPGAEEHFRGMQFGDRWLALASIANLLENERDGAHPLITTKHMPEVVEAWRVGKHART